MDLLNGGHLSNQPAFPGQIYNGGANKITLEQVDPSTFDDDSDDEDCGQIKGLKPGKKTKGRVKIKMEFIENKLRRYTTFSKRKTGIMKKAYELSTLTGTQVMLLVASETGHVYTFATRKLQPMITSESGKALIQTCLNSPDPPPIAPGQQQAVEQRMNPGGFEETELTYSVEEENAKAAMMADGGGLKTVYTVANSSESETQNYNAQSQQPQQVQIAHTQQSQGQTYHQLSAATMSMVQQSGSLSPQSTKTAASGNISLQIPGLPPGFILQPGTSFTIPIQASTPQTTQVTTSLPHQTVYRISASNQHVMSTNQHQQQPMTPSVFMYQTPQGIVYAPATGQLGEKTIFNFQQSSPTDANGQQQQIITIPIPVSLSNSNQLIQLSPADTQHLQELSQPVTKKSRKA